MLTKLAPLFAVLLLSGCTLQAKVVLVPQGPSEVEASLTLPPATRAAWQGLRDLDPSLPADPLAPALLQKGLGAGARVTVTGPSTNLKFQTEPRRFFPEWNPQADTWTLTLDRQAFRRLVGLTAWADSPALDALVPAPGAKVTEADYRELLVYLLGPGLDPKAAGALVDASTVELTIEAPRPIRSAEGAVVSGRTAVYRWPLVKALVLDPPLRIQLGF